MAVPIEHLQLHTLLKERVFVKWADESNTYFTLGSCLYDNKQNPKFLMRAACDAEGRIHIHFSLPVSIKLAGKSRQLEMLLVVSPDADFANTSQPIPISTLDDLSSLDASALHEAGISELEHIILLRFKLATKGFVITKSKTSTVKPINKTSSYLLRQLESLSNAMTFRVYIRPNAYAREGLRELRERLSRANTVTSTHNINMTEVYARKGAMLVDWTKFVYRGQDQQDSTPPPYTNNSAQGLVEVRASRSPPITSGKEKPVVNIFEATVTETPTRTPDGDLPVPPSPTLVLQGIFPNIEEPLGMAVSSDSPGHIETTRDEIIEGLGPINTELELDSDEENLANLNARELSQQLGQHPTVSEVLELELVDWVSKAMSINTNVYEHKRLTAKLSILGGSARASDTRLFNATRPWCSALFFYDPTDSNDTPELWDPTNAWLVSDIAKLIKWANTFHRGVEMNSLVMNDFLKLGSIARSFALQSGCNNTTAYMAQKSVCVGRVLVAFGKTRASVGEAKTVTSKRVITGAHSEISKRVR